MKKPYAIRIEDELLDKVKASAKENERSVNAEIRYLIKCALKKSVSHSTKPNYLDDKYEVKWLINNTYQVEQNENCVYQGSESDCNEWLKCELGYCG